MKLPIGARTWLSALLPPTVCCLNLKTGVETTEYTEHTETENRLKITPLTNLVRSSFASGLSPSVYSVFSVVLIAFLRLKGSIALSRPTVATPGDGRTPLITYGCPRSNRHCL
jgi:hypothetical protein